MDKCCGATGSSMEIVSTTASGSVEMISDSMTISGVTGTVCAVVAGTDGSVDGIVGAALFVVSVDADAIVLTNCGTGNAIGITVAAGSLIGMDIGVVVAATVVFSSAACETIDPTLSDVVGVGNVEDKMASAFVVARLGVVDTDSEATIGNAFGAITSGAGIKTWTIVVGDSSIALGRISAGIIGIGGTNVGDMTDICSFGTMQWATPKRRVSWTSIRPIN